MKSTKIGSLTQLTAETGYIHKLGTDTYAKTLVMLPGESEEMYVEVSEKPAYTKAEYDAKVAEMVRERYSESEEFALQRKMLNTLLSPATLSADTAEKTMTEYSEYNNYVERCKADAPRAILEDKARKEAEEAKMREEMES